MLRQRIQLIFLKPPARTRTRHRARIPSALPTSHVPLHLLRQLYYVKRQWHNPTAGHGVLTIN